MEAINITADLVEVVINPDIAPTGINQTRETNEGDGLVWGVTAPLLAGESLTLTLSSIYYAPDHSHFSGTIAAGSMVHVQVDAIGTAWYGAVLEADESNNISGPLVTTEESTPTAVLGTTVFSEKSMAIRP